jgi:hypothetical protein
VSQLAIAKCSACDGRFQVRAELIDCGLRCPLCKTVAKVLASDNGDGCAPANVPAPAAHRFSKAARRRQMEELFRSMDHGRSPLAMTILRSPGVMIGVIGALLLTIAMIVMSLSVLGGNILIP